MTQKPEDDTTQGGEAVVAVSCSPGTEQGRLDMEEWETEDGGTPTGRKWIGRK